MEIYLLTATTVAVVVLVWQIGKLLLMLHVLHEQVRENAHSLYSLSVLQAMQLFETGQYQHVCGLAREDWTRRYAQLEVYSTQPAQEES